MIIWWKQLRGSVPDDRVMLCWGRNNCAVSSPNELDSIVIVLDLSKILTSLEIRTFLISGF